MEEKIKEIFSEIDKAIERCICATPHNWNDSQFRKLYKIIKDKWLNKK